MNRAKRLIPLCGLILIASLFLNINPFVQGLLQASKSISFSGTISKSSTGAPWLHTSGTFIYDDSSKRVNLYTANIHYGGGQVFTLSDIQAIKAMGFNCIRLHIYWGLIQPWNETTSGIDKTYFTTGKSPMGVGLDQVVNWAVQENLYININLALTDTYTPPSWAFPTITDGGSRYEALFNGTASKERTGVINTWQYIAQRYKDIPNVVFEIMNEPFVENVMLAGNEYQGFNEEIISAIEAVETQSHIKIVELLLVGSTWDEILNTALDVNKPNVVWATHRYNPMTGWNPTGNYYHAAFTWNGKYFPEGWGNGTTYVAWRIIRCADKIHSWNKPWINTEFSKVVTQTGWQTWFGTVLSLKAQYYSTGWGLWCYSSDPNAEAGWDINDPATRPLIMNAISPYMAQP
jgi:hypothetical protein